MTKQIVFNLLLLTYPWTGNAMLSTTQPNERSYTPSTAIVIQHQDFALRDKSTLAMANLIAQLRLAIGSVVNQNFLISYIAGYQKSANKVRNTLLELGVDEKHIILRKVKVGVYPLFVESQSTSNSTPQCTDIPYTFPCATEINYSRQTTI
ncbi:hypothetical protein A6A19_08630 [Actinobacillus delphinicola]|uniref:Uncharacterized protein n=1 Tax=Actinobacillus delphinicola TaxID=51161 RepID=A0A448TVD2_9PAST|nr:hypothetical protein [Actinobacillus delphinicola]MDG6898040.1 hypothetical protein [Actinobacillus delphinicola]VEJ09906.1 Uncharacterised protein [Actinobacillus delphinicola]